MLGDGIVSWLSVEKNVGGCIVGGFVWTVIVVGGLCSVSWRRVRRAPKLS